MFNGDVVGVLLVYLYVVVLLLIAEKVLARYPEFSRKFLHIMTGNIAFFLPIFETDWVMAFIAAAPFIPLTFLMSPYTPIKSIKGRTSAAGHGMGLVYYSVTWTVLAYLFFDHMEVIAIGILAMSYGDGFASVFGMKFGRHKYNVFGDEKSFVGSLAMFIFTYATMVVALIYYGVSIDLHVLLVFVLISSVVTFVEGVTPKGLDNLSVPFSASLLYWFLLVL